MRDSINNQTFGVCLCTAASYSISYDSKCKQKVFITFERYLPKVYMWFYVRKHQTVHSRWPKCFNKREQSVLFNSPCLRYHTNIPAESSDYSKNGKSMTCIIIVWYGKQPNTPTKTWAKGVAFNILVSENSILKTSQQQLISNYPNILWCMSSCWKRNEYILLCAKCSLFML